MGVARAAYVAAFDETTKMFMVLRRCSLYNSKAPYWALTFNKLQMMIGRMRDISPDRADVFLSDPDHWELWNELHMAHDDMSAHLEKVIKPIKPIKPYRIRRLRLIAGMRIARWRGRKEHAATEAALAAAVQQRSTATVRAAPTSAEPSRAEPSQTV